MNTKKYFVDTQEVKMETPSLNKPLKTMMSLPRPREKYKYEGRYCVTCKKDSMKWGFCFICGAEK